MTEECKETIDSLEEQISDLNEKIEELEEKIEELEDEKDDLEEEVGRYENLNYNDPCDRDDPVDVMKWELITDHFKELSYLQTVEFFKKKS